MFLISYFYLFSALLVITFGEDEWKGRWFPLEKQDQHSVPMGISNVNCDNGISNISIDFDGNPEYITCYEDRRLYYPNPSVHPLLEHEHIPRGYNAMHYCMNETIHYNHKIPTFGAHRPLWPMYGEYVYVPKQRWLHNLEHGAVVLLYHPCADGNELKLLKKIVKNCLFRHIISPSNDLTSERPLCLLTWGYRLTLSKVDMEVIVHFIKHHANKAPEKTSRDGQYHELLIEKARSVSEGDTTICPFYNM